MAGHSADMKKIYSLKKKYKFNLIEDACHALGGSIYKKKLDPAVFQIFQLLASIL